MNSSSDIAVQARKDKKPCTATLKRMNAHVHLLPDRECVCLCVHVCVCVCDTMCVSVCVGVCACVLLAVDKKWKGIAGAEIIYGQLDFKDFKKWRRGRAFGPPCSSVPPPLIM